MTENADKYQQTIADLEKKRSELQAKILEKLRLAGEKCAKLKADLKSKDDELASVKNYLSQTKELLSLRESQVESQIKANEESIGKIQSALEHD